MKRIIVLFLLEVFLGPQPIFAGTGDLLKASGVKGGLVVCIGAESMQSVSRHWEKSSYIFQCLETDPKKLSSLWKKVITRKTARSHQNSNCLQHRYGMVW